MKNDSNIETFFCRPRRHRAKRGPFVATGQALRAAAANADQFAEGIALAAQVSKANLQATVRMLSSYKTRHTASPLLPEIAGRIAAEFTRFGYSQVTLDPYRRRGLNLSNVICEKPGTVGAAAETIILCGHFDSVNESDPENPELPAPGANDNATGIAVILETARILFSTPLSRTIRFVCFSGEEENLWGSKAYAAKVKSSNLNLRFLLNVDQIGYPDRDRHIFIEHDQGNDVTANDQPSQLLADTLSAVARSSLGLRVLPAEIERSDYMPFESEGYTVIGLFESGKYRHEHTEKDTMDNIDFEYLVNMAKLTITAMFA